MSRYLIIQLRQLGDILLTTPCISELRRAEPSAHISFLCHSMGRLILEDNPDLNEIYYYDKPGTWYSELALMRDLRRQGFSVVIDFMNNPRSALYALATGAPKRLAFKSKRSFAYTQTVNRATDSDYIVREKFRLLRALGISPERERLSLPWDHTHLGPFIHMVEHDLSFGGARLRVVISPTHRRPHRRWPLEYWARLAERLTLRGDISVTWLWGPGEERVIDAVMAMTHGATTKARPTSFREMAALIANCDLFIGNSNGPSHVAVAQNIPTLQIHGHTQATAWSPLNSRHRALKAPGFDISKVSLEKVWDEVMALMPVVEKSADERHRVGVKTKWSMSP